MAINYPPANREDMVEILHGVPVADPYRWLEDQDSDETREWLNAQDTLLKQSLNSEVLQSDLESQLSTLLRVDATGIPVCRNGSYFFMKRLADRDQNVICCRRTVHGEDEVLLDPLTVYPDGMTSYALLDVSEDAGFMLYGIREGGADELKVVLRDIEIGTDLKEELPSGRIFGITLTKDLSRIFYCIHTSVGPRIFTHTMGTSAADDVEIFGEGYGPEKIVSFDLSDTERYILATVYHGAGAQKTEIHIFDTANNNAHTVIVDDINNRFEGEIIGENLYLRTDWEAPNDRLLQIDLTSPDRTNWHELVPQSSASMQGFSMVGGKLFLNYLENVNSHVKVYSADGIFESEIAFPSIGSVSGVYGRWARSEAFFVFTSFHIPSTIYRYDVSTGLQSVWSTVEVPFDVDSLELEQVWFHSKDGTRVPMFLVHKRGLPFDGNRPVYMTAYGGFGNSMTPYFSAIAAIWASEGGVFALPNLRGGGEFGEDWHRGGMLESKQNSFDDLYAATQWLFDNNVTNPDRIAIAGGSNGGLLVGAAMTQHPEMYRAVICSVPLLDMVRYHQFLVASFWIPEYGSSDDPVQFKYLFAYSPYHHVLEGGKYPAVLFVTGDSDTRVSPLHARKMCALLQWANQSDNPILILYHTKSGHSGGLPITKQITDTATQLQFLFKELSMR